MKIVLASALYPPDIAQPAPYIKELAARLSKKHEVVVVTYGRLPEKIPGVRIVAVDKRQPLPLRLLRFFLALWSATRRTHVLYIENGPSVELPAALVVLLTRKPLIVHLGDSSAHRRAAHSPLFHFLEEFTCKRAQKVFEELPALRPEILPLEEEPGQALAAYERSWQSHLQTIDSLLLHAS